MQDAIKLWVSNILARPVRDLAVVKEVPLLNELLQLFEPSRFGAPLSTLDEILQAITQYYRSVHRIDVTNKVKSLKQRIDVLSLWELMLGIAIKCPDKNTYIKMILSLDHKSQTALMSLINMISEDCPELSMVNSSIDDGKDQKLENALLNTIDELTDENNRLREQLDEAEERFEAERVALNEKILTVTEEREQLRNQRLEVLGEYEAEYCSDSLLSIFKSMEAERDQLRVMLEARQASLASMQLATSEMSRQYDKMREENQAIKKQFARAEQLQREADEAQMTIKQLRDRERKYIDQICDLEERRQHLRRTLTRAEEGEEINLVETGEARHRATSRASRAHFVEPVEAEQIQIEAAEQKLPEESAVAETVVVHPTTTVKRELKPFVREENNAIKVKELNKVIAELNERLGQRQSEIEALQNRQVRRQQKIEDLESRCRNLEKLSEVYSEQGKQKEVDMVTKQKEYEGKFANLLSEISQLKLGEQKLNEGIQQAKMTADAEKDTLKSEYSRKVDRVVGMLEEQLLEFRDKELNYLQTIRQVNCKLALKSKQQERTDAAQEQPRTFSEVEDFSKPLGEELSTQMECTPNQSLVEAQLVMTNRQIQLLKSNNDELGKNLSKCKALLEESLHRQTSLLQELHSTQALFYEQCREVEKVRECSLKHMNALIQQMRNGQSLQTVDNSEEQQQQLRNLEQQQQNIGLLLKSIEQLRVASLQQLRNAKLVVHAQTIVLRPKARIESDNTELEEKKRKIIAYFESKLEEYKTQEKPVQVLQANHEQERQKESVTHPSEISTLRTEYEETMRALESEERELNVRRTSFEATIEELTAKIREKNQAIEELKQQLTQSTLELQLSKTENTSRLVELAELQKKCNLLEGITGERDNSEVASFVERLEGLVDEVSKLKINEHNNQEEIRCLQKQLSDAVAESNQLRQVPTSKQLSTNNSIQVRALRQANTKLLEEMASQQKTNQIFRGRYRELGERFRSMEQENRVLVCVIADLRVSLRASAISCY